MDYYCSTKFTDLEVHVQGRLLYNCCRAYPERISIDWLEQNPGRLFHTDTMLQDRKLMLEDKPCASCDFGCYKYERQGGMSTRLTDKSDVFISDPESPLRHLQIVLSTDCNLTCAYCGPQWSTSWHRDIEKNGPYDAGADLQSNNWSRLWSRIKQKSRSTDRKFFELVMKEIALAKDLKTINVVGGEPLLNNSLESLLDQITDQELSITSGLGVSTARLKNFVKKIKNRKVKFYVSAESTGRTFEFLRHGISWKDFLERIDLLNDHGVETAFSSTITNVSLFNFFDFYQMFKDKHQIKLNWVIERPWMMPHVIDDHSKQKFIEDTEGYKNLPEFKQILKSLKVEADDKDRKILGKFIKQFAKRRNISVDFLPKHFRDWCESKD